VTPARGLSTNSLDFTARTTKERDLQECIRRLAKARGLAYYHTHRAQHSPAGFPDCVIAEQTAGQPFRVTFGDEGEEIETTAYGARFVIAELKTQTAKPSAEQIKWLSLFAQLADDVGWDKVSVCLWRPIHWLDGSIDAVLSGAEPTEEQGRWLGR
jgi:hypothetical protein